MKVVNFMKFLQVDTKLKKTKENHPHATRRFELQQFSKPVYKYKKTVLSLHFLKNQKIKEDEITRDDRTSDFVLCFDV